MSVCLSAQQFILILPHVLQKSDAGLARDLLKQLSAQIAHANSLCARADDKIICNLWVVQRCVVLRVAV